MCKYFTTQRLFSFKILLDYMARKSASNRPEITKSSIFLSSLNFEEKEADKFLQKLHFPKKTFDCSITFIKFTMDADILSFFRLKRVK